VPLGAGTTLHIYHMVKKPALSITPHGQSKSRNGILTSSRYLRPGLALTTFAIDRLLFHLQRRSSITSLLRFRTSRSWALLPQRPKKSGEPSGRFMQQSPSGIVNPGWILPSADIGAQWSTVESDSPSKSIPIFRVKRFTS